MINRVCITCGKAFQAYESKVKLGYAKYCGNACKYIDKPKARDLTGLQFGHLKVVAPDFKMGVCGTRWLVRCRCGKEKSIRSGNLLSGEVKSCGCYKDEIFALRSRTHGKSRTVEYVTWQGMIKRCGNKRDPGYKWYGARGISVCARWRNSFENFLKDMGARPSPNLSIDRINNDGNYEPGNCRWATSQQQHQNKRKSNGAIAAKAARTALEKIRARRGK